MDALILHHYAASPFSEKVRLVLGMKDMHWRSVTVPNMLPKPDVVALTGGYRRTPFMQIGADIYCDSALMCRLIDRLVPGPPLYPESTHGLAAIVSQWADQSFFWTAVPFTMQPAGVAHVLAGMPVESVKAFGHGTHEDMASAEAILLASRSTAFAPCAIDAGAGIAAGTPVGVTPADYAHDEVTGRLVGLDAGEVVVERVDERAGTVHVHFPRVGYHVKVIRKDSP